MYKKAAILFILLLILPSASAIKILVGADNRIFFEPNMARELTFTISDAERYATVPIGLKGDMAKYATVEPSVLDMAPGERKEVKIKLQLPATLEKGVHALEVSATEQPKGEQSGAFIWMPAVAATLKIINTDVDYDCNLGTFTASMGPTSARTMLNVASAGRQPITASADLAIYDSEGIPIKSWKMGGFEILPFESKTSESTVEFGAVPPDIYTIKGTLTCGEKKIELSTSVINAATALKINDFKAYKKDGSLYIGFDLENEFNVPIDTYGIAWFYDEKGKEVDHTGLSSASVPPKGKASLGINPKLEWVPLPPGTYTVRGIITYLSRQEQREATFTLTEEDLVKQATGGGFSMGKQEQKAEETPQEIALEKPSSEGMSKKGLIRIIAGLLILILLTIIILKVLAAKRD